jgi:hypothetical protein
MRVVAQSEVESAMKEAAEAHAKLTSELKASQLELMAADVKKSDAIRAADTASSNASRAASEAAELRTRIVAMEAEAEALERVAAASSAAVLAVLPERAMSPEPTTSSGGSSSHEIRVAGLKEKEAELQQRAKALTQMETALKDMESALVDRDAALERVVAGASGPIGTFKVVAHAAQLTRSPFLLHHPHASNEVQRDVLGGTLDAAMVEEGTPPNSAGAAGPPPATVSMTRVATAISEAQAGGAAVATGLHAHPGSSRPGSQRGHPSPAFKAAALAARWADDEHSRHLAADPESAAKALRRTNPHVSPAGPTAQMVASAAFQASLRSSSKGAGAAAHKAEWSHTR